MDEEDNGKTKISSLFGGNSEGTTNNSLDATADMDAAPDGAPGSEPMMGSAPSEDIGFASEFKSDMASQLSMDISGFTQFFKDASQKKSMRIAGMVGAAAVVMLIGFFVLRGGGGDENFESSMLDSSESEDESNDYDDYDNDYDNDDSDSSDDTASEDDEEEDLYSDDEDDYEDSYDSAGSGGEGSPELVSPLDGQRRNYDETSEYALFEWSGAPGGVIKFSRFSTMEPLERKFDVSGNSYALAHPWPGLWYWQVENEMGSSAVSRFVVDAAVRRSVVLAPLAQPLMGSGGVISWQGDTKVARYSVELSQSGWSNPQWRMQTSSTNITLNNVTSGNYELRVGAFSEVAGRWEYTQPVQVSVE